jgi:DNA-binding transcriptional ArsR family regulator
MHLVPEGQRAVDADRLCEAISAIADNETIAGWAQRFELLGDDTRLALLICIDRAGPISVTDLAGALDIADTRVSQILRLLRAAGTVTTSRDGRVVRYQLADPDLRRLIEHAAGPRTRGRQHAAHS